MSYRGADPTTPESGEYLRFAVAFAGIVLYDYHMSNEPELEDEGQTPPDFTRLEVAAANPRAYQQWLDAQ